MEGGYISGVTNYYGVTGALNMAQMPFYENVFASQEQEVNYVGLFRVVGADFAEDSYKIYASIMKPDGTPLIDMRSYDEIVEVISMIMEKAKTSATPHDDVIAELKNIAETIPEPQIPWDLPAMRSPKENFKLAIDLEFTPQKAIKIPNKRKCKGCGGRYYFQLVGVNRSIDEEIGSAKICASATCNREIRF